MRFSKGPSPDGNWYRLVMLLNDPSNKNKMFCISTWSPIAGHYPVQCILSKDIAATSLVSVQEWQWKLNGEVLLPSEYRNTSRSNSRDSVKTVKLTKSILNSALADDQFSYRGLGLEDGDIVVDKIKAQVSKIENGHLVKLGNFGDK